jgi:hypothetical protein
VTVDRRWDTLAEFRWRLEDLRTEEALTIARRNLLIIELIDGGAHQGMVAETAGLAQGRLSDVLADETKWRQRLTAGENVRPPDEETR